MLHEVIDVLAVIVAMYYAGRVLCRLLDTWESVRAMRDLGRD